MAAGGLLQEGVPLQVRYDERGGEEVAAVVVPKRGLASRGLMAAFVGVTFGTPLAVFLALLLVGGVTQEGGWEALDALWPKLLLLTIPLVASWHFFKKVYH